MHNLLGFLTSHNGLPFTLIGAFIATYGIIGFIRTVCDMLNSGVR